MDNTAILKHVKAMLETNTMVNWGCADYTPEEEFQSMLDEIKKMENKQLTDYNRGWNAALVEAKKIINGVTNDN